MLKTSLSLSVRLYRRQQILQFVRNFFSDRGLVEVIPNILSPALPTEPTIYPFQVEWQRGSGNHQHLFLATSPESILKKLIAKGLGECFAIGHSFRNLESAGALHQPEFLMLEWYRQQSNYLKLMRETQELIGYVANQLINVTKNFKFARQITYQDKIIKFDKPWPTLSLVDLFQQWANIDLIQACQANHLVKLAKKKGYEINNASFEQLFNQIFLNEIEPHLTQEAFFLTDFPSQISPLARARKDHPDLAERFELYLAGMEIANGCSEQDDSNSVKSTFQQEMTERNKYNLGVFSPIDEEFVAAVRQTAALNLAGAGLGLDRLAMLLVDTTEISEVTGIKY